MPKRQMNLKLESQEYEDLKELADKMGSTPSGVLRVLASEFVSEVKRRGMILPSEWIALLPGQDGRSGGDIKTSWYKPKKSETVSDFPSSKVAETSEDPQESPFLIILQGEVAAGSHSGGSDDNIGEAIPAPQNFPAGYFALRICGRSMEPDYPDQSIVAFRPLEGTHPRSGSPVVYSDGQLETFKIFRRSKGLIRLESINPEFEAVEPTEDGRVVAVAVEVIA